MPGTSLPVEHITIIRHLLSIEGIGPVRVRNILSFFPEIDEIPSAPHTRFSQIEFLSQTLAKRIASSFTSLPETKAKTEAELERLEKTGGYLLYCEDDDYPALLKKIYDVPLFLYVRGVLPESELRTSLAVVGTRNNTAYGKMAAERICKDISASGVTIISGLARGIDTIAHRVAVQHHPGECKTIAVLGCGVDVVYPPENKDLMEQIAIKGAVVSEFPPGTGPDASNFPKRNRIIAGMAAGCLLVETGINGGAMMTSSFALDNGREIFAVPGNIGVRQSEGTNLLIQRGEAKLVYSADDILKEAVYRTKTKKQEAKAPPAHLTMFEQQIVSVLSETEPVQIDEIAVKTGISVSECLVQLLTLEFKSVVRQIPGKRFLLT